MGLRGTPLANATVWSTGARDPIQIARNALKEAQTQQPTISDDGRAMYPRSETEKDRSPLRFQKIEEKWYLK